MKKHLLFISVSLCIYLNNNAQVGTPVGSIGVNFIENVSPVNNLISISTAAPLTFSVNFSASNGVNTYTASDTGSGPWNWTLDMGTLASGTYTIFADYYDSGGSTVGNSNDYNVTVIPRPQWIIDGGSVSNVNVSGNNINMTGTIPLPIGASASNAIPSSVDGLSGRNFDLVSPEFLFDISFDMGTGNSITSNNEAALTLNTLGQNTTPWNFPFSSNPFQLNNNFELNTLIIDSVSYNPLSYKCNFPGVRFPIAPGVNVKVDAGVEFNAYLKGKVVLGTSGSNFGFINSSGHVSKVTAKVEGSGFITAGLSVLGGLASASGVLTAEGKIGAGFEYEQFPASNINPLFAGEFSVWGTVELKSLWGFGPEKTFGPKYFYGPQTFGPDNYNNLKTYSQSYDKIFGSTAKTYSINGTMSLPSDYPMPSFGLRGSRVYPVWVENDMFGYGYLRIATFDTVTNCVTTPALVIKNQKSIANPRVGIMPSGDAVITWSQNRYTQATLPGGSDVNNLRNASDIWLGIYHASTNSISDTMMITDANTGPETGRAEGEARIKMGSGTNGLITWIAKDPGFETTDIWFTNISQVSSTWQMTTPTKLADLPGVNKDVVVAYTDAVNAFAIWINDPDGLDSTLNNKVMISDWNGSVWSTPTILSANPGDLAYEELTMEYNYGYCAIGWTCTQYFSNGDFDKKLEINIWDDVAGTWLSPSAASGGNIYALQKPRISVSNTGIASIAYKVVDLFNDPVTPDPGNVYLYLKDLTNSNPWVSVTGNPNISDPTTNVWELNAGFGGGNKFYT